MKNLIYALALTIFTGVSAQNNPPVNVKEETTTKIAMVEEDGKMVEKKTTIKTKEVQEIKFDKRDKYKVNQDQIPSPTKVTETVMVDNDADPFYDTATTGVYYVLKDQQFSFSPNASGFEISYLKNGKKETVAKAVKSTSGRHYVLSTNAYTGVGFFDGEGNFIFEYYDKNNDSLMSQEYMISK